MSTALTLLIELMAPANAQAQACAGTPGAGGVFMTTGLCQDRGNTRTEATVGNVAPVFTVDLRGDARYEAVGVTLEGTGSGTVLGLADTATFSLVDSTINANGPRSLPGGQSMAGILSMGIGDGYIDGSQITATGSSTDPTTQSASAYGVRLVGGGTFTIHRSVIAATSDSSQAEGLAARRSGAADLVVNATDVTITTHGQTAGVANGYAAIGASAGERGTLNMTGGSVDSTNAASGDAAVGLFAVSGGTIDARGVAVTSSDIGALNIDGAIILGDDDRAGRPTHTAVTGVRHGVYATTSDPTVFDTTVTATNARISASAGAGIGLDGGANATLTGTMVVGHGAGVETSDGHNVGVINQLTVDGGSVTATAGSVFRADGGSANILVKGGAQLRAADGNILNLTNASNVTFTAQGEVLAGNLIADATSTGNAVLSSGTALTGMIQRVGASVDASSTWNVSASSTPTALVNAGMVSFMAPTGDPTQVASYKTLTTGSYVGNGGTMALHAHLGTDASPTDRLVLDGGSARGTTALKMLNTAGGGAQTTGDGIPVVLTINGATTSTSAFHLAGPVQAGAYQYLLYRGGQSDTQGWYLRSELTSAPVPQPSPAPVAYRPGVVGYTMTPSLNAEHGFVTLGRLHERVGDIASLEKTQTGTRSGVWGRIGGQSLVAQASGRFFAREKGYFAQFGRDWTLERAPERGSTHAGATLTFGSADAKFSDQARSIDPTLSTSTGSMQRQALSLAGYRTRYLPDGTYFDSVGQLTRYRNRYSDVYGSGASHDGFGIALSQEVGKRFHTGHAGLAIEPQVQLTFQHLRLNAFEDNTSAISGTITNALRGRAGVRVFRVNVGHEIPANTTAPYFTADVLHDFLGPGRTLVGGTAFESGLGRTWFELGLGVSSGLGASSQFYAHVKYKRHLGGQRRESVLGQAGYRYSW